MQKVRVRFRTPAGSLLICHSRELFMHRVRVTAGDPFVSQSRHVRVESSSCTGPFCHNRNVSQ